MGHKGFASITIVFLVLAWYSWKDDEAEQATTVAPQTTSTTATNSSGSQHSNIEQTLRIVAKKWKSSDVNKDGLYNCIDAAVLFYKYYPDKSKVAILVNKNPSTDMHHLFNAVLINRSWRAVEPQAYYLGWKAHNTYFMRDIWGSKYDASLNKDAWNDYGRFVK